MILYDVGVTRNLCGHVLIEACSADEAEKIAYDRYIKQGRELPEDVYKRQIYSSPNLEKCFEFVRKFMERNPTR